MDKKELIKKITLKKEFSKLPKKDVELVFEKFDKDIYCDEEKIKLTRDLLRKVYSSFSSRKLLEIKERDVDAKSKRISRRPKLNSKFNSNEWVLNKHKSTKERLPYYEEVYVRIFENIKEKDISVIDLGAGVNGFSYGFFNTLKCTSNKKINYIGVEAVGQLVELVNYFFEKNKISGKVFHLSLFEIDKIKKLIKKQKKPRIVFLFKVIDSLEVIERNYSKKLLEEIVPLVDMVVLSFATRSLGKRSKFSAHRSWIKRFIDENFEMLEDFEIGGEQYLIFQKDKTL